MTHVSKDELSTNARAQLHREFVELFVAQTTKHEVGKLVSELFTPAETLMLAKRVAVIALLHRDCSAYEIAAMLKVSASTAARIDENRERGKYAHIEKILERKKSRESLLGWYDRNVASSRSTATRTKTLVPYIPRNRCMACWRPLNRFAITKLTSSIHTINSMNLRYRTI